MGAASERSRRSIRVVLASVTEAARVRLALKDRWSVALTVPEFAVAPGPGDLLLVTDLHTAHRLPDPFRRLPLLVFVQPEQLQFYAGAPAADDVLVAPWTEEELRFRVRRILGHSRLDFGRAVVTWGHGRCTVAGPGKNWSVQLTGPAYQLFCVLVLRHEQVVSRSVLISLAGLAPEQSGSRALDMSISRLRRGLADLPGECPLSFEVRSLRGRGYMLGVSQKDLVDNS